MGISIPTLPIANKYTKDTTIGMGAIKGAAAQFGTPIPATKEGKSGHIVPLIYEDNEGEQHIDESLFIADGRDGTPGTDGDDGVGIASIEKTSTSGNVDTYTITLTNGSSTSFTVTNGVDGADGKDGKDGVDGAKGDTGKGIKSIDAPDPNKAEIVITYDDDTESDPIEIPTVEGHDEPLTPAQINTLIALL